MWSLRATTLFESPFTRLLRIMAWRSVGRRSSVTAADVAPRDGLAFSKYLRRRDVSSSLPFTSRIAIVWWSHVTARRNARSASGNEAAIRNPATRRTTAIRLLSREFCPITTIPQDVRFNPPVQSEAMAFAFACLEHDPEKWKPVFPRDKRGTRLRGDHAQTKS